MFGFGLVCGFFMHVVGSLKSYVCSIFDIYQKIIRIMSSRVELMELDLSRVRLKFNHIFSLINEDTESI